MEKSQANVYTAEGLTDSIDLKRSVRRENPFFNIVLNSAVEAIKLGMNITKSHKKIVFIAVLARGRSVENELPSLASRNQRISRCSRRDT